MKLYVGNLSFSTSSKDLEELFSEAGEVESARIVVDRETGRTRGFGFVEMATTEEGEAAIAQFHGKEINGRSLSHSTGSRKKREIHGRRRSGGGRIVLGELKEVKGATFVEDRDAHKRAEPYFTGIAQSRNRTRKLQTEIDRLKKKTEAIIDKLS